MSHVRAVVRGERHAGARECGVDAEAGHVGEIQAAHAASDRHVDPSRRVIGIHTLRNSLIPLATTLGHIVSIFVAGSVLIELIFEINGFGLLGYNSILDRDYPLVMGATIVYAAVVILANLAADLALPALDPRRR